MSSRASARWIALLAAAALAGASGLALQVILASSAALPLGHGTGPALALTLFLSAWALGAWFAGRFAQRPRVVLVFAGAGLALFAVPAVFGVLYAGPVFALVAIAVVAGLQGTFLPLLARGQSARIVAPLVAANLLGAWAGAGWIADGLVASHGRGIAAAAAGACAVLVGFLGLVAASKEPGAQGCQTPCTDDGAGAAPAGAADDGARCLTPLSTALVIGLGTAWMGGVEWSLVRLGALWFGGMQDALTAVLTASLAGLALGAALLPAILPRGARGVSIGLLLCAVASLWILVVDRVLPGVSGQPLAVRALVLCVPAMLPFGALVPLVHRAMRGESGRRLGALYLHEVWGALLGIPLVQLVLAPHIGLAGGVAVLCASGAIAALSLSTSARIASLAAVGVALLAAFVLTRAMPPAMKSPPLSNPALTVRSFVEDHDFAVTVVDDGLLGERTLLTDGFRAAGTGRDYRYMRVLGHLPVLLHPDPKRVAVLALGTGTTVGAVSLHPDVERIDVLEISRAVVEAAPLFAEHNRGALAEGLPGLLDADDGHGRVVVKLGDGRKTLRDSPATYDVVTMEPLLPDSPFGVHLYTEEAYADVRLALRPGGIACQWVPPHALEPATYEAVVVAFGRAFPGAYVFVSGTQVILVSSRTDEPPGAERFSRSTGDLAVELTALGIGTPADLAARQVARIGSSLYAPRLLTDRDPWIAYRPRRTGAQLLLDLPSNLPSGPGTTSGDLRWTAVAGDAGIAASSLREARRSHAWLEAGLRGAECPGGETASSLRGALSKSLAEAAAFAPEDPELREFRGEVVFLEDLRSGVAALAADPSKDAAITALDPLTGAAQARPERADVHAYVAAALSRLGSPAADKALDFALERCPRLAETDVGRRAHDLGLSDEQWKRVTLAALLARSRVDDSGR